jgi:hypothetical protein
LRHQLEPLVSNALQPVVGALVGAAIGHAQVAERDRIEVVVGKGDETKATPPQLHHLLDQRIRRSHARLLAVGAPHRAERTMLRAAAHRLHRRHHVAAARQQIPARRNHRGAFDLAAFIHPLRLAGDDIVDRRGPHAIAIALDDRRCGAVLEHLVGIERGVDAAIDDMRAARFRGTANFVAPQAVQRMNAYPDHVARADRVEVELFERLVDDVRVAVLLGRGGRQNIEPARRYDRNAKGHVTWIDEMDAHQG